MDKDSDKKTWPEFIAYHFLNIDGKLMCMEEDGLNTDKFLKEGFNVDGSSVKGMSHLENSDLHVVPEKDSYLSLKIGDFEHHRFWCHLEDDTSKPHPCDPRSVLRRAVDKAHKMGFEPEMFSEIEFYIVDMERNPADHAGYCSLPPYDKSYDFRHELGSLCKKAGMSVKRIHHECGPGQNEMELALTPCMKNADDTVLAIWILRLLAAKRNQKIIFSPKPFDSQAGNGFHHHILFRDIKTGENVFMNKDFKGNTSDPEHYNERLSKICRHGIAGLLKYADEITAVFASHRETFERLKPGYEAPIFRAWDFSNRTALVRVPKSGIDMTRFEYRGGDLSGSVHLYGAVLLSAVLKGIEDELPLQENTHCNIEHLSEEELKQKGIEKTVNSFEKCIEILKTSEFLKESMGKEMVDYMIKRNEEILAGKKEQHLYH